MPTIEELFGSPAVRLQPLAPPPARSFRLGTPSKPRSHYERWGKRLLDAGLCLLALPVALPLGSVLFLLNSLSFRHSLSLRNPFAAFFLQERVGRNGRVFRMVKFRTMKPIAGSMSSWSSGKDGLRVTRFGQLLRNTHLDELPQLLNVLRGEMSLIGPRPEMIAIDAWASEHVPGYADQDRHLLPGLTGLAQITQGYVGCDVDGYTRKLELNQRYGRELSLRGDLAIVLRTVLWMIRRRGWQWKSAAAPAETAVSGRIHRALAVLFETLEENRVPYAILRGEKALLGAANEADVDILLGRRHSLRFEALLASACHDADITIHEEFHAGFLAQYHLTARGRPDSSTGREFLALDVHSAESCYGVPFFTAEELLQDTQSVRVGDQGPRIRRLRELPSALVDFLGPYLSAGVIRADYAERLRAAVQREPREARRLAVRLFGSRLGEPFIDQTEAGVFRPPLERMARSLRRAAASHAFGRRPLRSLCSLATFFVAVRLRPLLRPRGKLLVFLGTDGSGKSTLAREVCRRLEEVYRDRKPELRHLRPGLIPQLNTLFHLGRTTYGLEDMQRPHRARPSGALGSNLRVAYYWLDYVLGYALRIRPLRRRHALVVFDRYFYDYLVDPLRSRIRRGTLLARLLSHCVPRPDHVFVCSADPATVRARKQELCCEETRSQLVEYEALARRRGFTVVDTQQDLSASADEVLEALFAPSG